MTQGPRRAVVETAMGWVGISGSERGLECLTLPCASRREALKWLGESRTVPLARFGDLAERLAAYYNGQPVSFPDRLDLSAGTTFERQVWAAARRIPYGQTKSYGSLAGEIGKPGAARAVGQALGRNRLPVVIPCHRVTGADGWLGGYRGGAALKERLLCLEARGGG